MVIRQTDSYLTSREATSLFFSVYVFNSPLLGARTVIACEQPLAFFPNFFLFSPSSVMQENARDEKWSREGEKADISSLALCFASRSTD